MSGLSIKGGAEVESGGRRFIIMQLIGFDSLSATAKPMTRSGWTSRTSTPSRQRLQPCRRYRISPKSMIAIGPRLPGVSI
jgi:hypothetical protein